MSNGWAASRWLELRRAYPHAVRVQNYVTRAKAGHLPHVYKLREVNAEFCTVREGKNTRLFMFRTVADAEAFKAAYPRAVAKLSRKELYAERKAALKAQP